MKGWETKKLSDLCDPDKQQANRKDLPYVGLEHIVAHAGQLARPIAPADTKSSTFHFSPEHLLYGRLRPYLNKVATPQFEGHCSTEILPLKPKQGTLREYLKYWFLQSTIVAAINATSTGTRMPRAKMNTVLNFDVPHPSLPEQQRIVSILDEALDGIATAKANAEKNLRNARELFETERDALFLQTNGAVRLLSAIAQISTGPFGSLLHKSDYVTSGTPLVNPINIILEEVVADETKTVGKRKSLELERYRLQEGDIVIARRGEIGRCAAIDASKAGWICGTGCFFIRPTKKVDPGYLAHLLRSRPYRSRLEKQSGRATMPSVSNRCLSQLEIHLPSLPGQIEKNALLGRLREETQRLEAIYTQKLTTLAELKQSILHQAFTGQL